MDEVAGGLIKGIVRIFQWMIIEVVLDTLNYWYDRTFLKILTVGKFPRKNEDAEDTCILTGVIAIIFTLLAIAFFYPD